MKKISKVLTTGILLAYSPAIYAQTNSSRIADLEERLAKIERSSEKLSDFVNNHKLFGRLQFDSTHIVDNNDDGLENNSRLRRGRIGLKGSLGEGWSYKSEVDFAKDASNVTDAYIQKSFSGSDSNIKIGQQKEPFSLDELTSSRFITFVERAAINGFAPGRAIGISYNRHYDNFNVYAGIFGDDIGSEEDTETDDETTSGTVRVTFHNKQGNGDVVHLGAAYRTSSVNGDAASYSFKPEATIDSKSSVISTGSISDVEAVNQLGLEAALVQGPISLQGEYISTEVARENGSTDYTLDGYYLQASYFITGEKRNYKTKSSAFDRVTPESKSGAWEVAYRFSEVDANDEDLDAGSFESSTFGVNYYATKNVKFMANYIMVDVDDNTSYSGDAEIASFRAQVDF